MTRIGRPEPLHPGASRDCPECHGDAVSIVRQSEVAVAELCACVKRCPDCRGTGWVMSGSSRNAPQRPCTCQIVVKRIRRFNQANIPARHAKSTRATFKPSGATAAAFTGVSAWLRDYQPGEENRGLVLYGPVGTGKTHLMVSMLRELAVQRGVQVRFVEFSHLLADLKSAFDRGGGASKVIDPLVNVDVLAIDELGKGRNTEWEGTVLDELISRRYNAAGTIIATTNYKPIATGNTAPNLTIPGQSASGLIDRIGDRVFSRLNEMADFIEVDAPDYRRRNDRR